MYAYAYIYMFVEYYIFFKKCTKIIEISCKFFLLYLFIQKIEQKAEFIT